jgi:hypothetical protein
VALIGWSVPSPLLIQENDKSLSLSLSLSHCCHRHGARYPHVLHVCMNLRYTISSPPKRVGFSVSCKRIEEAMPWKLKWMLSIRILETDMLDPHLSPRLWAKAREFTSQPCFLVSCENLSLWHAYWASVHFS